MAEPTLTSPKNNMPTDPVVLDVESELSSPQEFAFSISPVPHHFLDWTDAASSLSLQEQIAERLIELQEMVKSEDPRQTSQEFYRALGITPSNWQDFKTKAGEVLTRKIIDLALALASRLVEEGRLTALQSEDSRYLIDAAEFLRPLIQTHDEATGRIYAFPPGTLYKSSGDLSCGRKLRSLSYGEHLYSQLTEDLSRALAVSSDLQPDTAISQGQCFNVEPDYEPFRLGAPKTIFIEEQEHSTASFTMPVEKNAGTSLFAEWEQIGGEIALQIRKKNHTTVEISTSETVYLDEMAEISLKVTDGYSVDTAVFPVVIRNSINETPTITLDGPGATTSGKRVTLSATAQDPNPQDHLIFSWEIVPAGTVSWSTSKENSATFNWVAPLVKAPTVFTVRLQVLDGHDIENTGVVTIEKNITVSPQPNPLVRKMLEALTVTEEKPEHYRVVFVFDVSGSMEIAAQTVVKYSKMLVDYAASQTQAGGTLETCFVYADSYHTYALLGEPTTSGLIKTNTSNTDDLLQLSKGVTKVGKRLVELVTEGTHGRETLWYTALDVGYQLPVAAKPETITKIILISDEELNQKINLDHYTTPDNQLVETTPATVRARLLKRSMEAVVIELDNSKRYLEKVRNHDLSLSERKDALFVLGTYRDPDAIEGLMAESMDTSNPPEFRDDILFILELIR